MSSRRHSIVLVISICSLLACAGFSIGLTFAPCYSSMCVEAYFPLQTRVHIALFYGLLSGIGVFLLARRFSRPFRAISEVHIYNKRIPFADKRLSVGAVLLVVWITGLTFGSIGYWLPAQRAYWLARGRLVDWTQYMFRLIWTGVTGHWCDILIGLVLIPVGRHSVVGEALQLDYTTLLFAHKLLAYSLCVGGLIHGLLYYSFLAAWVQNVSIEEIRLQFIPDNPLLTWPEGEVKGPYSWFNLPTGALAGIVLIPVIVITSLPILRRLNYNTFYFIHIIFAVLIMILVCLHASTSFYFILPGLLLWLTDWSWRLRHSLYTKTAVQVESAGNGWYRIRLPSITTKNLTISEVEKADGTLPYESSMNPLQTYYVNVGQVSRFQSHPFTAALPGNSKSGPILLFQRAPERKKAKRRDKEWTWKLAALQDGIAPGSTTSIEARIEGPYSPLVPEMYNADVVLAIVGGTGITGAIAVVNWWLSRSPSEASAAGHLRLIWTVKEMSTSHLQEIDDLLLRIHKYPEIELRIHCSNKSGRINPSAEVIDFLNSRATPGSRVWMYFSGPEGLMTDAENACFNQQKLLRQNKNSAERIDLSWYVAKFTV